MKCTTCDSEAEQETKFCGICGTGLYSEELITGSEQPQVGFCEAINRGFSNYFNARTTRSEYW